MIKNIIIVVLLVIAGFFIALAFNRAEEAERHAVQAEINLELALENKTEALMQKQEAIYIAAELMAAQNKAEALQKRLDDCK